MSSTEKDKTDHKYKIHPEKGLIFVGASMLLSGIALFILTFFPVIKQEVLFRIAVKSKQDIAKITPLDRKFGIVIPKIKANTKVIANVDPMKESVYQQALTKGVAHARGTVFPGQTGNTFIFAHSAGNWYVANQYNAVFYLLYKLSKGDEIDIYYENKLYIYKVRELKYINPKEINYLSAKTDGWKTLTLMTCWPPGTTLKRLIVVADMVE